MASTAPRARNAAKTAEVAKLARKAEKKALRPRGPAKTAALAALAKKASARSETGLAAIRQSLHTLEGHELVALVGEVMASQVHWKSLRPVFEEVLRAAQLAPLVEAALVDLAPRVRWDRLGDDLVARARIVGEAKRALITEDELLTGAAVSKLLGSRSENQRQYANRLRLEGELLGIPRANLYVYPAFQIDVERARVHPDIKVVGDLLDAMDDPWGVLSWWQSPNSRIGDRRPRDLLGTGEALHLRSLAESVIEPVG